METYTPSAAERATRQRGFRSAAQSDVIAKPLPDPARIEGEEIRPTRAELEAFAAEKEQEFGLREGLLRGLIEQESGWNPSARGRKTRGGERAVGLGQLLPTTAQELGVDPEDPYQNIRGAAMYLRRQLDAHEQDEVRALAAYNAGPGSVAEHGGVPPFPETQQYVKAVPALARNYTAKQTGAIAGEEWQGRSKVRGEGQQPVPWPKVVADPRVAKLSPEAYETLRQRYFERAVAPRLKPEQREVAWQAFEQRTRRGAAAVPAPDAGQPDPESMWEGMKRATREMLERGKTPSPSGDVLRTPDKPLNVPPSTRVAAEEPGDGMALGPTSSTGMKVPARAETGARAPDIAKLGKPEPAASEQPRLGQPSSGEPMNEETRSAWQRGVEVIRSMRENRAERHFRDWLTRQFQPGEGLSERPDQQSWPGSTPWSRPRIAAMLQAAGVPPDADGSYNSYYGSTLETELRYAPEQFAQGVVGGGLGMRSEWARSGRFGAEQRAQDLDRAAEMLRQSKDAGSAETLAKIASLEAQARDLRGEAQGFETEARELDQLMRGVQAQAEEGVPPPDTLPTKIARTLFRSGGSTVAGLAGWVVTGTPIGAVVGVGMGSGDTYQQSYIEAKDRYKADDANAHAYGLLNSFIEAGGEAGGAGAIAKSVKAVSPEGLSVLRRTAAALSRVGVTGEATTEAGTEAWQFINEYATFHPNASVGEVLERLGVAYATGAITHVGLESALRLAEQRPTLPDMVREGTERLRLKANQTSLESGQGLRAPDLERAPVDLSQEVEGRAEPAVGEVGETGGQWDPLESTCRHASLSIL